jgi:hypothetical protein
MVVSLAYFLYDFACCLVIDPEPVGILHHLCTTAGLVVGVAHGKARSLRPMPHAARGRADAVPCGDSAARSWWAACC